ncbi:hypothetical protein NPIL_671551 [Nephila pilipes]|uniref:Uncharacterized protein n=1 Tax=Nephila pilipes TaxID=299642 RepID=A0A8X6TRD9_NEPPI|nr:hypothetical protein NPIL_671551 [Nephila pilipes]
MTQVSIPEIQGLVNNLSTSDQCLHADSKIAEYLLSIPQINFLNQEEKNEYSSHLYTIQEEVRGKFNLFKSEELRQETEKYKNLINSWGLPDSARPQPFQQQSRRKNNTPIKTPSAKKQKTIPEAAECQNRFQTLSIDEPIEEIEIDDAIDEVVTPAPPKKTYAPPITIDNVSNSAALLRKLQDLTEKRETRTGTSTARPNNSTAPTSYADAARSTPHQAPTQSQAPGSIGEAFTQLKDPECVHMFRIIKKYISISKSNKSTADKFTEIMTLLEIDNTFNVQ